MEPTPRMRLALALHYDGRFAEASAAYQSILDTEPTTDERAMASQQIDNLRRLVTPPSASAPSHSSER